MLLSGLSFSEQLRQPVLLRVLTEAAAAGPLACTASVAEHPATGFPALTVSSLGTWTRRCE